MNLTEAYEKLTAHHDEMPPTVRDALDVVLGARCPDCVYDGTATCPVMPGIRASAPLLTMNDGCRRWEKREETTA